jgi:hypothetical protein
MQKATPFESLRAAGLIVDAVYQGIPSFSFRGRTLPKFLFEMPESVSVLLRNEFLSVGGPQ